MMPPEVKNTEELLLLGCDDPIFSETIKALRAKIELKIDTMGIKTIALTSAISGEGKTLVSAKLAASVASTGIKRVLLVDSDLRKGDLTRGMGYSDFPGLSEHLMKKLPFEKLIHETSNDGLHFIPSGKTVINSHEMISGDTFGEFVQEIRKNYDLIVLDTPPILPIADALAMRSRIENFLLVFRASVTPFKLFRQAADEFGEQYILGVVFNGVEPESQHYYQRYYGDYYLKSKKK
jgi:capsular exopolysaccharide synthesis family protein